jgi:isoquinoline 1-oxidoreductase beta subunit
MRLATADGPGAAISRLKRNAAPSSFGRAALDGAAPPYSIPHVRVKAVRADLPYSNGYMLGSPQRELTFFTESFIDELAHAAGMEPLAFRMSMLGSNPQLARCFQAAAQLAQWDGGGRGSNMGIAGCSAFGSHIALVATATIGEDQKVKAHRLVAAVDCGAPINPGLVIQQVEARLIWALAQATLAEPEWVAGMPRARPLGALGLPRLGDTPEIVVQLISGTGTPGGVSGLGATVLAPALANAIYAGTGKRMRSLPFDPMSA